MNSWLVRLAGESSSRDPRVAVLDWDNTCIFGDVQETLFRYLLDRLAFRLTDSDLRELTPERVNGVAKLADGVHLSDLRADLLAAWGELRPFVERGEIAAARALPAHTDFRAKMGFFYDALAATPGIGERHAYAWVSLWIAGMTPQQARDVARDAILEAAADPIGQRIWRARTPGRAGPLEYRFAHGIRAQSDMQTLMDVLGSAGCRVYVVSASPEPVVEAAAILLAYPIDAAHIYGVRVEQREGRYITQLAPEREYPFTYRQGKVDCIRRFLPADPLFAAGDSDTDFEMLTAFDSLQMRVVINRNRRTGVRMLYDEALDPAGVDRNPRTLLQGRNENFGSFQPSMETTPPGALKPNRVDHRGATGCAGHQPP